MDTSNYSVEFDSFTERYYVKKFIKKYKSNWYKTGLDIVEVCKRIDVMLQLKRADLIQENGAHKLVKLDFAIEGTKTSPKKSGNRCILYIDEGMHSVRVLLVYSKNEICEPNETAKWQKVVREQFPEIMKKFVS